MFSSLGDKLVGIFDRLRGKTIISEEHITAAVREIKIALLEADVALPVVKNFIDAIKEKALGKEVISSVTPIQMIIKIVHEELISMLGSETIDLNIKTSGPAVIMMLGLQGSGKTTATNKLASYLKRNHNKKVLMASLDTYRPAAQQQLETLGKNSEIATLPIVSDENPIQIAYRAMEEVKKGYDVLILDTAGRLHVDDDMMSELEKIKSITAPNEQMLVLDSLTGQDAVNIGKEFHKRIAVTGVTLTRVDADGRGGAALSIKMSIGVPIKFIGTGEKVEDLQSFDPERIASRILDMGDVVTLVESASDKVDQEEAEKAAKRLASGKFDLTDYIAHINQIKKMGGLSKILSMIPGMRGFGKTLKEGMISDSIFIKHRAMVNSMTPQERAYPHILKAKRKIRVANGSGTNVQELNKLLKQFGMMQKMMTTMGKPSGMKKMQRMVSSMGGDVSRFLK